MVRYGLGVGVFDMQEQCLSAFGQLWIQQKDATKLRDIETEAYLEQTCVPPATKMQTIRGGQ